MYCDKNIFLESVLKAVPIHCAVTGDEIVCRIRQEYVNTFSHPLEVVYTFPTPHAAAVTGLTVTVGSRCIETKIMEKEAANEDYAKQIVDGNSAFLLESERPNINRLSLGRVEPGERISAETQLCMTAEKIDDAVRICIPTAIAPRYLPCTMTDTPERMTAAQRVVPPTGDTGYMIEFDMHIDPLGPITVDPSPSHSVISRQEDDGTWHIALAGGCCEAGHDIVVLYHYTDQRAQNTGVSDGTFLLAQLSPDNTAYQNTPCASSFVLDCSGSMADQLDDAKQALRHAFQYLKDGDAFQIIGFNTGLLGGPCQTMRYADPYTTEDALRFIEEISAGGGTEMMVPLRLALMPQTLCRQHCVLLITDGQVGNDREIITMAQQRQSNTRLFTVGIGVAANSYLVSELAVAGRGVAEHVYPGENITRKIERQMIRCAGPRITDAQLAWADGRSCRDTEPPVLPELYDGEPLRVMLREDGSEVWPLRLSGTVAGTPWECTLNKEDTHTGSSVTIGRMWARARLARLERDYDASENTYIQDELKNRAIALSAEYSVLCRWTTYYSAMLRKAGAGQIPVTHHVPNAACARAATLAANDETFDLPSLFAAPVTFSKEILQSVDVAAAQKQLQQQQQRMHTWRHILDGGGFYADKNGADELIDTLFALWAYSDNMVVATGCPTLSAVVRMLLGHRPIACMFDTAYYNILLLMIDHYLGVHACADPDDFVQDFLLRLCDKRVPCVPFWVERLMVEFALMISQHSEKRQIFCGIARHVASEYGYQLEQANEETVFQAAMFAGMSCRKNIVGYVERR